MADTEIIELTADEKRVLIAALKRAIDGDRYFLSSRVQTLKSILSRLEPPKPAPPPLPRCSTLRRHGLRQHKGEHGDDETRLPAPTHRI
jgi:hypothetical protein